MVIPFRGYEISIALDDSHRGQNLTRATLAVFRNDEDVTADFSSIGNFTLDGMIYPTGEELFKLMQAVAEKSPL
jgi:arabinogalactan endo-1,4-beta-galactosidase